MGLLMTVSMQKWCIIKNPRFGTVNVRQQVDTFPLKVPSLYIVLCHHIVALPQETINGAVTTISGTSEYILNI